jgi:hypothetical protein
MQEQVPSNEIVIAKEIFKEIFGSIYGIKNLSYLKESYQYFDKYGAQRKIDFAIFLQKRKLAVLFEENFNTVREEYRAGDRKIVETSLRSQGWDLFFWSNTGREEIIRKNTMRDLQKMMGGRIPKFSDHMDQGGGSKVKEPKQAKGLFTPVLVVMAIIGAAILFPTISDQLLSYTKLSDKSAKRSTMISDKPGLSPTVPVNSTWKEKFIRENPVREKRNAPVDEVNEVNEDETLDIDPDDF